jgi:1L-myo-inositol 1-phosphate cytidylyltransferase
MEVLLRRRSLLTVTHAIILAAGNGDRFLPHFNDTAESRRSKLVRAVLGTPLIIRTLDSAVAAGIRVADVVLGYDADEVRALVNKRAPASLTVRFHLNERWGEENGLSVLAARLNYARQRFAVLMGDHLFESPALARLLSEATHGDESLLGIDTRPAPREVSEEATRVRLGDGNRIEAIGKMLQPYHALDTGLFVCTPSLFGALDDSCHEGDTTLSGGIRKLASRGLMRGVDLGEWLWCDIDTAADLKAAEDLFRQPA